MIDAARLAELYVERRMSREEIAAAYGVSTWQVTLKLRAEGVERASGGVPREVPSPPARELARHYLRQGWTLSELVPPPATFAP